jgi:methanethiol S-methyltransferase
MRVARRFALIVAWIGAALFAASLVWFTYCYLVRFGRATAGAAVLAPVLVNLLLFSAFALHHSAFARSGAKEAIRRMVPAELERSVYTWIASLLFLAVCAWWRPVPGVLYELRGPWRFGAWGVQVIAILLTLRASHALDVLDLAGVRAVQRSLAGARAVQRSLAGARASTPVTEHPPLSTSGLYGFVRHPLYFAWALFVFATPAMTGTRAAFAVISTAYLMIAIPWEERDLIATFGPDYEAYRRKVRARMIPWVY